MPNLLKEYKGHKIEVIINPLSGKEEVKLDGNQISINSQWFKRNSYHYFQIIDNNLSCKGYVQVRTFLVDCLVGIKIVINGEIIEKAFWRMPVQMDFRQLFIWLICLATFGWGIVGFNKHFNLYGQHYSRMLIPFEMLIVFSISTILSNKLSRVWSIRVAEKINAIMSIIDK